MKLDLITEAIIREAIDIHRELGPGLVESVYNTVLARALHLHGFSVERQKSLSFEYRGMFFPHAFRVDLVVNGRVIVEVKSSEKESDVHKKQLLTYLRLAEMPIGLLINFGQPTLLKGLCRIVNNLDSSESPSLRINATTTDPASS